MFKYKRIMVIGCSASGKSTFSRRLSEITGIPVTHLDTLFWKPGWIEEDRDIFREKQRKVIVADSWIIDWQYKSTMEMRLERAQLVFWYRLSRFDCVTGYLRRLLKDIIKPAARSDITEGCDEKLDFEFIRYIWNYNKTQDKPVEQLLKKYPGIKVITFKTRKQADAFLKRLGEKYKTGSVY